MTEVEWKLGLFFIHLSLDAGKKAKSEGKNSHCFGAIHIVLKKKAGVLNLY